MGTFSVFLPHFLQQFWQLWSPSFQTRWCTPSSFQTPLLNIVFCYCLLSFLSVSKSKATDNLFCATKSVVTTHMCTTKKYTKAGFSYSLVRIITSRAGSKWTGLLGTLHYLKLLCFCYLLWIVKYTSLSYRPFYWERQLCIYPFGNAMCASKGHLAFRNNFMM